MKQPKFQFKGIVKGGFSYWQASDIDVEAVMKFEGRTLKSCLSNLVIPEWIGILKVNGVTIPNIMEYIEQQGLKVTDYMREEFA